MGIRFWVRYIGNQIFWFFGRPLRKAYAFLFRPTRRTVKVLVKNGEKILLVRPNYSHRQWTLPGGKVERRETFEEAAIREVREETGIRIESPRNIDQSENVWEFYSNTVKLFYAATAISEVTADQIEISDVRWFPIDALPADRSGGVDRCVNVYKKQSGWQDSPSPQHRQTHVEWDDG